MSDQAQLLAIVGAARARRIRRLAETPNKAADPLARCVDDLAGVLARMIRRQVEAENNAADVLAHGDGNAPKPTDKRSNMD